MNRTEQQTLYEDVAGRIAVLIDKGTLRPGDRVPSIRSLSQQFKVSINTVREAYSYLEDRRLIEARPQSGYYVCARLPEVPQAPKIDKPRILPAEVGLADVAGMILRDSDDPGLIQLGCAIPNPEHLPIDKLTRMMSVAARSHKAQAASYAIQPGYHKLRVQIARRMLSAGCTLRPDEIVITSGATEAVFLALTAICRPGDTVALESPVYFNFLQLIDELGLKALEIPSSPEDGISLEALRYALDQNPVKACMVVSNFSNPLGGTIPDPRKKELVQLLAERGIPLIEDDIYGDLSYDDQRPTVARSFDKAGNVLLCSSFSKTLAPGFRVGWIAPGRFQGKIERLKNVTSLACPTPTQMAIAEFLANGGYDHHLRTVRRIYAKKVAMMGVAIGENFPEGTRVTRPTGGFALWVELPPQIDTLTLYGKALEAGITIAPGAIFSATGKYRNYVRLNAAFWNDKVAVAIETLGKLAKGMMG